MSLQSKTCAKTQEKKEKLKIAKSKVTKILRKIDNLKLNYSYVSRLDVSKVNGAHGFCVSSKCFVVIILIWFLLFGGLIIYEQYLSSKDCVLELPTSVKSFLRPSEDCSSCDHVYRVDRRQNLTAYEFKYRYAYSMRPVIVTDATHRWKATTEFSYKFFVDFYRNVKKGKKTNECFYFPYQSGLNSLQEVFSMDEARANLSGEPWYVGWGTCFDEETRALREYYSRPYFLPVTAESDMVDWIFMGGPGQGAPLHLDSVKHMSWQAQIRGRKQWQLVPPHECFFTCPRLEFIMEPNEILVVDTNRWYHTTSVLPGDVSITIGAEYD